MFTGIIETLGTLRQVRSTAHGKTFLIEASFLEELCEGQSIAHNGICLTVEKIFEEAYQITAINETLAKTTADTWKVGDTVNLERALRADARLDGHFVQGHIDTTTQLLNIRENFYTFRLPASFKHLIIPKGSIAIDGVSLTLADLREDSFTVALIPHTLKHTTFGKYQVGTKVNIEFDVLGKYIARLHFTKNL